MERAIKVDPSDSDDVALLNGLFSKGYVTVNMIPVPYYDLELDEERPHLFYHLRLCNCPVCRQERGEEPNYEDDGEGWTPECN